MASQKQFLYNLVSISKSPKMMMYNAYIIVYGFHDRINVLKNKYGPPGEVTKMDDVLETVSCLIDRAVTTGNRVFDDMLSMKIKDEISNIFKDYNVKMRKKDDI